MTTPQMDWQRRMSEAIDELPNTSDEEKLSLKRDLFGVNALSSVDHDYCDGCGQLTVVTDVWIDRCPTTLCQPCVLDALTAEGEQLGRRRKCCGGIDPSCDGAAVCADHGWREVERLHAELVAAHARIDVLSELLGDLLNDCDNWGIVPHTRYEEALA